MTTPFNRNRGLIIVQIEIEGPTGRAEVDVAIDTGATHTVINTASLLSIGYDPTLAATRRRITTASGIVFAPRIQISRLEGLEEERRDFQVLAHTLPPTSKANGLLGLDFFRGKRLALDFLSGEIELT